MARDDRAKARECGEEERLWHPRLRVRIINNFSSQQKDIHFNSMVRGQKPEEVSRYYILYDVIEKKIISYISFQVFPFNVNVGEHRERFYLNSRRN